jgi:hypothetical protein
VVTNFFLNRLVVPSTIASSFTESATLFVLKNYTHIMFTCHNPNNNQTILYTRVNKKLPTLGRLITLDQPRAHAEQQLHTSAHKTATSHERTQNSNLIWMGGAPPATNRAIRSKIIPKCIHAQVVQQDMVWFWKLRL